MTPFEIVRLDVKRLSTGSDVSGEYSTEAEIDAFLNHKVLVPVYGTPVEIDRLRFICPGHWCNFSTYEVAVVFAGPRYQLDGIPVHPRLLAKLYRALINEKKCERYDFRDDFNELIKEHRKAIG